jgi:hypothetical protein
MAVFLWILVILAVVAGLVILFLTALEYQQKDPERVAGSPRSPSDERELNKQIRELYCCAGCRADPGKYVLLSNFAIVAGDVPFGRCEKCRKIWCRKCAKQGLVLTCPECGGDLKTKLMA